MLLAFRSTILFGSDSTVPCLTTDVTGCISAKLSKDFEPAGLEPILVSRPRELVVVVVDVQLKNTDKEYGRIGR